MRITKNKELLPIKIKCYHKDSSINENQLSICYQEANENGEFEGQHYKDTRISKYAIVHHSEMTDINIFFIADNEQVLLDNSSNFDRYIWSEDNDFNKIIAELNRNGIEFKNDEVSDIEDNILIIDYQSYRF